MWTAQGALHTFSFIVHETDIHTTREVILSTGQLGTISNYSFPCVCPVIDHEFRHNIVKVAVDHEANNCLQIMVCSCVVPSKRELLQIISC